MRDAGANKNIQEKPPISALASNNIGRLLAGGQADDHSHRVIGLAARRA